MDIFDKTLNIISIICDVIIIVCLICDIKERKKK